MIVYCGSFKPEDTVFSNAKWRVIQVSDRDYPGFCRVIWNEHVREMTDLDVADRLELMNAIWTVEKIVRDVMQPDKNQSRFTGQYGAASPLACDSAF